MKANVRQGQKSCSKCKQSGHNARTCGKTNLPKKLANGNKNQETFSPEKLTRTTLGYSPIETSNRGNPFTQAYDRFQTKVDKTSVSKRDASIWRDKARIAWKAMKAAGVQGLASQQHFENVLDNPIRNANILTAAEESKLPVGEYLRQVNSHANGMLENTVYCINADLHNVDSINEHGFRPGGGQSDTGMIGWTEHNLFDKKTNGKSKTIYGYLLPASVAYSNKAKAGTIVSDIILQYGGIRYIMKRETLSENLTVSFGDYEYTNYKECLIEEYSPQTAASVALPYSHPDPFIRKLVSDNRHLSYDFQTNNPDNGGTYFKNANKISVFKTFSVDNLPSNMQYTEGHYHDVLHPGLVENYIGVELV